MAFLLKVYKKLKYLAIAGATVTLIKIGVTLNAPVLTARFASWLIREFNRGGTYRILCMRRSIFMDDVRALSEKSGKLQYLVIDRWVFQLIFRHYADPAELAKLTENNYHELQLCKPAIDKYNAFLRKMLPALKRFARFDAIFSGNFVYIEQQEIGRLCEELRIPYIVLHKESLTVGIYKDSAKLHHGCKFLGAKMMVYNEAIVETLSEVMGQLGIAKEKFVVVGPPRLDYLFEPVPAEMVKNQVAFFSFLARIRFPRLIKDEKVLEAIYERADNYHRWMMNFAKDNPETHVIMKTKTADYYFNYVKDLFKKYFGETNLKNLDITSTGQPDEMIKASKAIVSFGSMTMMEAIIANKPIVSAYFGDFITDEPWDYFGDYPQMINYAKTEEEFKQYLQDPQQYKRYTDEDRQKFLKRFIYIPDGKASERTEAEMIKTIVEYQGKK